MAFTGAKITSKLLDAFFILDHFVFRSAIGENDRTLLCLMSMAYHWGRGGKKLKPCRSCWVIMLARSETWGGICVWACRLAQLPCLKLPGQPENCSKLQGGQWKKRAGGGGNAEPAVCVPVIVLDLHPAQLKSRRIIRDTQMVCSQLMWVYCRLENESCPLHSSSPHLDTHHYLTD